MFINEVLNEDVTLKGAWSQMREGAVNIAPRNVVCLQSYASGLTQALNVVAPIRFTQHTPIGSFNALNALATG